MTFLTRTLLVAALAGPAMATGLSVSERAALAAAAAPALEDQRAAGAVAPELGDADRAGLLAAQQRAPELGELRAGDVHLNDHDLKVIGITVLIVLLIVIIA